jgi:hypothetical protein
VLVRFVIELADRSHALDAGQHRRRGEDPSARQCQHHSGVARADVLSGGVGREVGELPPAPVAGLQEALITPRPSSSVMGMVTDPANRADSRFASGMKPTIMRKCIAATVTARNNRPAPAAMPMAADPHCGRGGQPVHGSAAEDDDARAEKADARDDLGRHTRRVDDDEAVLQHVGEAILADEQDQGGRSADDGLGAHPGALALDSSSRPINEVRPKAMKSSMICPVPCPWPPNNGGSASQRWMPTKLSRRGFTDDFRRAARSIFPRPIR